MKTVTPDIVLVCVEPSSLEISYLGDNVCIELKKIILRVFL